MGRPKRASAAAAADVDVDMEDDKAEKARIGREKAKKSYKEDSDHSDGEVDAIAAAAAIDPKDRDFSDEDPLSPSESEGSEWDGESSGSEYGKKKKTVAKKGKGKASVKRPTRGRKASASPVKKGGGRGRGRPPAAASSASKNGKKAPVKRARDSEDESESEAASSGSEYGKKKAVATPVPKKKAAPAKAKLSPRKRGAGASSPAPASEGGRARRGRPAASKSYKEVSEDDLEAVSDEDKPLSKRAKLEAKPKPKEKVEKVVEKPEKKKKDEDESLSDEEESMEDEEEEDKVDDKKKEEKKKEEKKKEEKKEVVKKNGTPAAKKVEKDKKIDKDEDEDDDEDDDIQADKNGHDSESEEEKVKDQSPGTPAPASEDESVEDGKSSLNAPKNRTDTDYSKIDFKNDKKTPSGDASNFKIACWNIGGIKAWIKKNGLEYLNKEDPDILCLNEVKCNEKSKPEELSKLEKYPHMYWSYNSENAGHSGVAIFSKEEANSVQYGFPEVDSDSSTDKKSKHGFSKEGRLITVEFDNFYLINAYVPNSGRPEKSDKFPKGYPPKVVSGDRQKFDEFFRDYIKELEKKKSVIVTGDLNVAHEAIDLANPKTNERTAGFTKEEREGMTQLLEETTLFDSFRTLYRDQKDRYTFWSYMHNSRQKNTGWRLDYFLMSEKLRDSLCDSVMRTQVYGSDHCPIVLFMRN